MRMSEIVQVVRKSRHSNHGEENKLLVAYTVIGRKFIDLEGLIFLMNIEEES